MNAAEQDEDAADDQRGLGAARVDRTGCDQQPGGDEQPGQAEDEREPAADAVRGELPHARGRHVRYVCGYFGGHDGPPYLG
jgi:hypothetical protein